MISIEPRAISHQLVAENLQTGEIARLFFPFHILGKQDRLWEKNLERVGGRRVKFGCYVNLADQTLESTSEYESGKHC